ncbi:hypothetical protein R5R35_008417 [Gryllus longicercus]|uniref:Uncharacterized protein n=1 Tax=Gryllus longicercus TaxID=2509291 RepID=A0AAN9VY76_9ORTH
MGKNTRTDDTLNHTDILANEISADKMMSKVNTNDENIDKNKSKEAKNVDVDLNHKFHNSEKKIETNSLSPKNEMPGDKKCTVTDEVIPYTINGKINLKETCETTHTHSSEEFLNSKIKETASGLLPTIKNRVFKTSECSIKRSLKMNTVNKIKNERYTEQTVRCNRKQSQFNPEKGKSECTTSNRRSKRIQNARRQSENIFESNKLNTSRKREEKQNSDNDFDEKKYLKNISKKKLQTTKKEELKRDFVSSPCISDKYIDRNRQKIMDTGVANKVQSEGTYFKRKLKNVNADCGINKIQDMHVTFSDKGNEICENLCKSHQDKRVEIKFVNKHENNNQESNCQLLVPETPSTVSVENCINLPNEETPDAMKTSIRPVINEIISVNEENNDNPEEEGKQLSEVNHPTENTRSKPCSLKKYRKPTELCKAETCEFQTCSSGTEVAECAEVNGHNLVHNNPENNDDNNNNNNNMCLQEREKNINSSNELSHAECVNLKKDSKEIYSENRDCASETVINIEGASQEVFVQNEVQGNPNSENEIIKSINNNECDTKEGIAQLSPCSQSDVSFIVTNAIVHNSSPSSSPIDNQHTVKSGVDTVITQSVKVFKFFTQNITSVEKNNDSLHFQDKNKTNTAKHIVNALVKDSVEKMYIQETLTSKRQYTDSCKKGKAAEAHCEDSNDKNKVKMINGGTCASTKEGENENLKTNNTSRKKKNLHPVSRSDTKPIPSTRTLRKRKAVSYTYNSPVYTENENKGKYEVNNCSHNKVGRSSVKKRLFTQNEIDIISLCSGSQNSCLTENGIQKANMKEIPSDTKKCDLSVSQNNIHDEFDKLLTTSPPPLPKRNPNHWKEKYRKDIQLKSLKQTSNNQKIVNSKKTKRSVYSDLDSSSDMSVFFDSADHERKAIAAEDREKANIFSLIKIKNRNSEINSKSMDPQSDEKNTHFHLNPNNLNDILQTNKSILSPKVICNKLPSSIVKESNSKVISKNPKKNADEEIMDKENQGFQEDGKLFVKNSVIDVEPEKVKKRRSKNQIKSENNKEIDCNSKYKIGEQIIQEGNSDKLIYMMSTYNNKITTQTGKTINNEGCSEQLQQLNVNCSLERKAVYQDTDCENKMNEVSSVLQNKEAQNKVENIKCKKSIDKSNQKDLCNKKRKLIVYSDTDSDCDVSVSATNAGYQNKETCTFNLQINKSNENFSENDYKGSETNAANRDTSRNEHFHLNPSDSIERLQTNESTMQLTTVEVTNQPETLVNNTEFSKLLQLEKGNNCITEQKGKKAFQWNENYTNKSTGHETKCNILNKIDIPNCREQESQISPIHSTNKKEKCHEINDKYINETESCKDQRIIGRTLKCIDKFENKRKKHKSFQKLIKSNETSPLFFKNRHCNKKFLHFGNYESETIINNEYLRGIDSQIGYKKSIKNNAANCSNENDRSDKLLNDSKNITKDNRRIQNTKELVQENSVSCFEELSESQEVVDSQIYQNFHTLQPKCQLEINGKLNIDDDDVDNVSMEENGFSNRESHIYAVASIKSNKIVKRQSKGQIQSKKSTSQLGYKVHKNQIEHRFLPKPLVCKWSSETDGSSLSSSETINEFPKEQSTSVRKMKKRKPMPSFLKKEFQKSTREKKKCIKQISSNISNTFLGHFSQSSHIFHARRTDSRKHLDKNVGHKIQKLKNSIQTLDDFIEGMEERIEEVNLMVMNQNCHEEDIKQNFIHIENEYMKFAADLSNEPKFDIQHLISSLGENFRKEILRNMLKNLRNVSDTCL